MSDGPSRAKWRHCAVENCPTNNQEFIKYSRYSFPPDENFLRKWLELLELKVESLVKSSRVCSLHFDNKYIRKRGKFFQLVSDAIPLEYKVRAFESMSILQ